MNNYIGKVDAEWVDPMVELPPEGWSGWVRNKCGSEGFSGLYTRVECWTDGWFVAWLRIGGPSTAIPRGQVQAAVDHAKRVRLEFHEIGRQDMANAFYRAEEIFWHCTGIKPTEVTK